MSYDIELLDPITKKVINFDTPHQLTGGTYAIGGTTEARLNITWNYSMHFYNVINSELGIRFIYDKTGAETISILKLACEKLDDDVSNDYWESTEGNAKAALLKLIALAQIRPDGIWQGD